VSRTWTLTLPWTKPPLTLNGRQHHMAKARTTKTVRATAALLARKYRIPPLARCEVLLTYYPRDKRRRDEDNLVATLKACCDGIVDAQVVRDDTPDLMTKPMPRIGPVVRPSRLTLTITELPPEDPHA
jgi:crossover junction endodeoxyribonuclease RusA